MSDIESTVLTKAFTTGKLEDLIAKEIEPDHFADELHGEIFEFAQDFFHHHQATPSMEVVSTEFPNFKPKISKDPLSYHLDKFIEVVTYRRAVDLIRGYHEDIDDRSQWADLPLRAMEMARELIDAVPGSQIEKLSDAQKRRDEYYLRKKQGIEHGILLGIPSFDEVTFGTQPYELVVFGGKPGAGKSTMLVYAAVSAYLRGRTVYLATMENTAEQTIRKIDTMLAEDQIRYSALKSCSLTKKEEEAWDKILERAASERHKHDIYVQGTLKNASVEKIAADQMKYKPDLVVVDYLELMKTRTKMEGWQSIQENGRGLKQTARLTNVPCYVATQLNRTSGDTSYQSAEQIADILINIRGDQEDEADGEMELVMKKNRDGASRIKATMVRKLDTMNIHEKSFAERFPIRNQSLLPRQRKLEQEVEVATIIHGRKNPWSRQNGQKENPWRKKNGKLSTSRLTPQAS
jgi:replicative DNA helicase